MYTATQLREIINQHILALGTDKEPGGLFQPITYALSLGGKRLRPILTLMAYNLYKEDISPAIEPALGMEIYHNHTLLHDDVMDHSDLRRGYPTVNAKWDNNTAILSGDAMFILACERITRRGGDEAVKALGLFLSTAMDICRGQQMDMDFESRQDVTMPEYLEMIRLKTAVLISASVGLGAMLAQAPKEDISLIKGMGLDLGMAFQLQDDLLDVYGNSCLLGKNTGMDIVNNKKTYLLISALEKADTEREKALRYWLRPIPHDAGEKTKAVTAIYDALGIKALCREEIARYMDSATHRLNKVSVSPERKKELSLVIARLTNREI